MKNQREKVELHKQIIKAIDNISDGYYVLDRQWRIIYMNKKIERICQKSAKELIGKVLWDVFPVLINSKIYDEYHKATSESTAVIFEMEGKYSGKWYEIHAYPSEIGLLVYFHDITNRKQTEKELKNRTERLGIIPDNMLDMISQTNEEAILQYVSPSHRIILGYKPEDMLGMSIFELVHPDDINRITNAFQIIINNLTPEKAEFRYRHAAGHYLWLEAVGNPLFKNNGLINGVILCTREITERKKVEESLRMSEEIFSKAFNANPNPMAINTLDGRYINVNNSFTNVLGYLPEETIGLTPSDLNIFSSNTLVEVLQILLDNGSIRNYEAYIQTKTGDLRCGVFAAEIVKLVGNSCILSIFNDITERKLAEKSLWESRERYRSFIENSRDAIFVVTPEARYIEANPAACEMTGYNRDEILQMGIQDLLYQEYEETGITMFDTLVKLGTVLGKITMKAKDGSCIFAEINATVLPDGNYLGTVRDITGRRKMEKEMAQLERLNLVGQMAAGIGHEIRNPMTTVRGFLQMLMGKKEYSKDKEYFTLMIEELDRANSIITEFLSIARNKPDDLKKKNINSIIESLSPLITADAMNSGKDVVIELADIPETLLNEAMESGRILTIKTFEDGDEIVFSVADEGKGISGDLIDKIGTPFFTTKENGTGLGLATCYGISARHNARLDFETGENGTTFFVRFRRSRKNPKNVAPSPSMEKVEK